MTDYQTRAIAQHLRNVAQLDRCARRSARNARWLKWLGWCPTTWPIRDAQAELDHQVARLAFWDAELCRVAGINDAAQP